MSWDEAITSAALGTIFHVKFFFMLVGILLLFRDDFTAHNLIYLYLFCERQYLIYLHISAALKQVKTDLSRSTAL